MCVCVYVVGEVQFTYYSGASSRVFISDAPCDDALMLMKKIEKGKKHTDTISLRIKTKMPRFMIKALLSLVRRIKRTEMNKRKED